MASCQGWTLGKERIPASWRALLLAGCLCAGGERLDRQVLSYRPGGVGQRSLGGAHRPAASLRMGGLRLRGGAPTMQNLHAEEFFDVQKASFMEAIKERSHLLGPFAQWDLPPWSQPRGKSIFFSQLPYKCHQNRVASVAD